MSDEDFSYVLEQNKQDRKIEIIVREVAGKRNWYFYALINLLVESLYVPPPPAFNATSPPPSQTNGTKNAKTYQHTHDSSPIGSSYKVVNVY